MWAFSFRVLPHYENPVFTHDSIPSILVSLLLPVVTTSCSFYFYLFRPSVYVMCIIVNTENMAVSIYVATLLDSIGLFSYKFLASLHIE